MLATAAEGGQPVALGVAGGIAATILFVVAALGLAGRSNQFTTTTGWTSSGDCRLHDRVQEACVIFER